MNAPALPKFRMTVDEFLAWSEQQPDDRYELVDGKIIAMTRDTVQHNLTKFAACRALYDAVRAAKLPCTTFIDGVGVTINERTLRIPDVVVHCGDAPAPNAMTVGNPIIVLEVVSPSSERDDTETKLVDYFSLSSVRHYLIVVSGRRAVVHHRRNERGSIDTRILHDGEITLEPPGMTLPVVELLGPAATTPDKEAT
jgi:Uma2 family endonuclease